MILVNGESVKTGRNDPCICGSGKKYKNCCLAKESASQQGNKFAYLDFLFSSGKYEELENCARILLDKNPQEGVIWKLLGLSLQMQGKEALSALTKGAALLPDDAEAHANLAAAFRNAGMLEKALESSNNALRIKPDLVHVHNNLGLIHKDMERFDEAVKCFEKAVKINPNLIQAHINLGGVLRVQEKLSAAKSSFQRALKLQPSSVIALTSLASVFDLMGDAESAKECCQRALSIEPGNCEALIALGVMHIESGDMSSAEKLLREVLQLQPENLEALGVLVEVKKVVAGNKDMEALLVAVNAIQAGNKVIPIQDKIFLNFALGKCFDDLGECEQAFQYYLEGNRLKRGTIPFNSLDITRKFDAIRQIFSAETIEQLKGGSNTSKLPIFVLGMPRSGTTLMEQIISSHHEVYGAGELNELSEITQREVSGAVCFPENLHQLDHATLKNWADEYIAALTLRAPDSLRIVDKQPENFRLIGLIHALLPNAKIIHISRNPADTCHSCFTKSFSKGLKYTNNLRELGQYYVDYTRLMDHWRKVLPTDAFLDVRYEDVVNDLEANARRIIDFCDLEWTDACMNFHTSKRTVRTSSYAQVRQPIYKSSVERWRPYEKELAPLLDALGELDPRKN
ncbi:MAG: sulfotransferase [Gallionella sp.]